MKHFSKIAILLAVLLCLVLGCSGDRQQAEEPDHELAIVYPEEMVHFAELPAGWKLSIIHFDPVKYGVAKRENTPPVILLAGITSTSINYHLGGDFGLAPYLAKRGYDVWAANLRARREGNVPTRENGLEWGWDFFSYLNEDMPAILDTVLEITGEEKAVWIGHSMGGLLLYTYLQDYGQNKIHAGVAIASPMVFGMNDDMGAKLFFGMMDRYRDRKKIGAKNWAQSLASSGMIDWEISDRVTRYVANPDNFSTETRRLYLYNSMPDLSATLMVQFADRARSGSLVNPDDGTDYLEGLKNVSIPMLVLAGAGDFLCPPEASQVAFEELGSSDKTFNIFSKKNGYAHDYGHVDLCLGDTAPEEVYPYIENWLSAHVQGEETTEEMNDE